MKKKQKTLMCPNLTSVLLVHTLQLMFVLHYLLFTCFTFRICVKVNCTSALWTHRSNINWVTPDMTQSRSRGRVSVFPCSSLVEGDILMLTQVFDCEVHVCFHVHLECLCWDALGDEGVLEKAPERVPSVFTTLLL